MQTVSETFTEGSYRYAQVVRQGVWAIYSQTHKENPAVVRYEVVRIRIVKAHVWPNGTETPEHEGYPGATRWGVDGFTTHALEEAQALLGQKVAERPALASEEAQP
jgi:hypothetical protein